jgi:hypothetical protein
MFAAAYDKKTTTREAGGVGRASMFLQHVHRHPSKSRRLAAMPACLRLGRFSQNVIVFDSSTAGRALFCSFLFPPIFLTAPKAAGIALFHTPAFVPHSDFGIYLVAAAVSVAAIPASVNPHVFPPCWPFPLSETLAAYIYRQTFSSVVLVAPQSHSLSINPVWISVD